VYEDQVGLFERNCKTRVDELSSKHVLELKVSRTLVVGQIVGNYGSAKKLRQICT